MSIFQSLPDLKLSLVSPGSRCAVKRPVQGEDYRTQRDAFLTAMCKGDCRAVSFVSFYGESGIDAGGLTREACTLAFKYLQEEMGETHQALKGALNPQRKKLTKRS